MAGQDRDIPLIGVHQLGFEGTADEHEAEYRTLHMIARALNIGRTIAFVGSGISRAYGHPTWNEFAEAIVRYTFDQFEGRLPADSRGLLESCLSETPESSGRLSRPDRTLTILGVCDEIFETHHQRSALRKRMAELAGNPGEGTQADPLRIVLERLRIHRFLTTNYDREIEKAFVRVLGCGPEMLGLRKIADDDWGEGVAGLAEGDLCVSPVARSLLIDPEHSEALAQFAIAAPGFEMGVFHCHGVADDPQSMIVTERDYQRVYLQDDPVHRAYREALNFVFSGNPVLFLGIGMEEPDLLRPLREFVSMRHRDARERPLFALMPRPATRTEAVEFRKYLYVRYGVKVLYYDVGEGETQTTALCRVLEQLADGWAHWWRGWMLKPSIRRPQFNIPEPDRMVRHYIEPPRVPFDNSADEARIRDSLGDRGAGVLVLGRLGTGKGNLGLQLVCSPHDGRYRRRFFSTLHFSNDMFSMIEAAADFLGAEQGGDLLDRLRRALMNDRHLLVIGGFERLLVSTAPRATIPPGLEEDWTHPMNVGQPVTREAERLLEIVAEVAETGKSHIVLTSSVEPIGLSKRIKMVRLHGISFESLRDHEAFRALQDQQVVRDLHGTLRGHLYALSVVAHALHDLPPAEGRRWLEQLVVRLTPYDLPRRAALAVEAALELLLRRHSRDAKLLKGVLERVALFSTPVNAEAVLASCGEGDHSPKDIDRILEVLVHADLLMKVGYPSRNRPMRYTAHSVVRTYVLHTLGNLPEAPSEPHRLSLSGFANESEEPQPISPAGHALAIRSIDALLEELERGDFHKPGVRRDIVRAAFGLMRSRWSVIGVGRYAHLQQERTAGLPRAHYEAYERRLARLLNAIRRAPETRLWLDERGPSNQGVRDADAFLYADELAWLFNELTLVAFCQGAMPDAYSLARSSEDIGFVADNGTYGPRWCQAQINLALVHIDRARLQRARYHLDNAIRGAQRLGDKDMECRINGYMGLVCHLSGMYPDAEALYRQSIEGLEQGGNRRGVSIFRRHRADLLRKQDRLDEAKRDIQASIVAAEAGGHPDLVQYSRVADANLRLALKDQRGQEVLLPAIEFARTVGLPKLEADTYKVQGHIALEHGETELAGRLAVSSLGIASAHGMRLRLTAGLVFMGRVARIRGDSNAARGLFRSAIELGQRQGYQMQVEEAERELMRMSSWEPAGRIVLDDRRVGAPSRTSPARSDRYG